MKRALVFIHQLNTAGSIVHYLLEDIARKNQSISFFHIWTLDTWNMVVNIED
jgi:hypothetical protein